MAHARQTGEGILDQPGDLHLHFGGRGAGTGQGADRFEAESLAFHTRLREAFLAIARAEPQRCAVIDAARDPDSVESAIRATVASRLPGLLPLKGSRGDAA